VSPCLLHEQVGHLEHQVEQSDDDDQVLRLHVDTLRVGAWQILHTAAS